jgi:hypothetical protein
MPRVVISGQAARRFTGGLTEFEVEANNFRRMVLELDRRFPGLGRQIEESMAVAIDGEIFQDAYLAPLNPDSEIYLIPKIGAVEFSPKRISHFSHGPRGGTSIHQSQDAALQPRHPPPVRIRMHPAGHHPTQIAKIQRKLCFAA